MAKKLKKLNYVENLITFISRMQSSNWVDEDEPTPPTPTTLTPFALNQYVQGGIINVEGDTTVLDTYLANFPTTYGSHKELIKTSDPDEDNQIVINIANTMSGDESWWENYVLYVGIGRRMFVYSTNAQHTEVPGAIDIPGGWNELNPSAQTPEEMFIPVSTNQEVELEKVVQVSVCDEVANDINGVYFGAIEGEQPVVGLTPFSVGQYISGVDFGDVQNGDISEEMETFFASLGLNSGESLSLVTATDDILTVYAQDFEGTMAYVLTIGEGMVYSTMAFESTVHGFNNLIDGKHMFSDSFEVEVVNQAEGWNGILVGAVEGQPVPVGLTPFSVGQSFGAESLKVNINKTTEEVASVIANMEDDTSLVSVSQSGQALPLLLIQDGGAEQGGKIIVVADMPIFVTTSYEYEDKDSGKTITVPAGWQYDSEEMPIDRETGIVDLSHYFPSSMTFEVSAVNSEVTGWNGEIVGYGNEPIPVTFTAFTVNETSDGIDFGNVNNGDTNADLESALEDLSENTYVTFSSNDGISIASDDGNKVLMYRDETTSSIVILYATGNGDFEGTAYTRGYQNLTDGKYTFDTQKSIITVSDNGKFTAINGVLFGNYKVGE